MNDETKNNIKIIALLFVVFVILYALHVTIGKQFFSHEGNSDYTDSPTIIFETDTQNKILTVSDTHPEDMEWHWPQVSLISLDNGSATLPHGTIQIGDQITDCKGYFELVWETTGSTIITADFR